MKKIIKALMVGLALTTFASCSDNEAQPFDEPEVNSDTLCYVTVPDTTKTLTADRAMMIAARHSGTGADSRTAGRLPASIDAVNDEDGNPLMYVVNYTDNKGFVILSASKEYYPILAESDEGSFDIRNLEPEHPVNLWLDEQKFLVEHIDALPDSVKTRAASLWMEYNYDRAAVSAAIDSRANYPEKPQVYYDSLRRWTLDPNIEVYTYEDYINTIDYRSLSESVKNQITIGIHTYGNENYGTPESSTLVVCQKIFTGNSTQLLSTFWHQDSPFNDKVPNQTYLGCTTVAIGQIMKYHQFPNTFLWDNMPNETATIDTQNFLYELRLSLGIDYNAGSSASNITKVKKALEQYGYNVTKNDKHNASSVLSEVINNCPVYIQGIRIANGERIGHAWICDGYQHQSSDYNIRFMTLEYRPTGYTTPETMIEAYKISNITGYPYKYHFNWGGDKSINGYFYDSNISYTLNGEIRNYNIDRKDLLIRPKK